MDVTNVLVTQESQSETNYDMILPYIVHLSTGVDRCLTSLYTKAVSAAKKKTYTMSRRDLREIEKMQDSKRDDAGLRFHRHWGM